jgi:hypothetical protein
MPIRSPIKHCCNCGAFAVNLYRPLLDDGDIASAARPSLQHHPRW